MIHSVVLMLPHLISKSLLRPNSARSRFPSLAKGGGDFEETYATLEMPSKTQRRQ
ncbi:hypothetical protein BG004_000266, partial [Podila humilis]